MIISRDHLTKFKTQSQKLSKSEENFLSLIEVIYEKDCHLQETCMEVKKQQWTRHRTMDWFQTGKGVHQGCILSPWVFNLYAKYIMQNAILDEAQAGIKIAGRNINNLRYADDTTLISSVQFSCSVVSNSLQPHESQHVRPPCPSPTPRVHPNSCSLSQWCHPAISSSVIPFSSCPQSLPASGFFPMSQLFA